MSASVQKNIKNLCAAVCFLLVFLLLFGAVSDMFMDKEKTWYKHRNYSRLASDSVDILYVGNSHFNAAIDAELVDDTARAGTYGFNYGVSGMRMEYAYYRLLAALSTQKPRLVVLDTFCLVPVNEGEGEEGVICWSLDGMPLSRAKAAAVEDLVPRKDWASYFVPFIKYHSRWENLTIEDVTTVFSPSAYDWFGRRPETNGDAMSHEDDHFSQDLSLIRDEIPVDDEYMDYLNRFIRLAEENGAQVLLLGVPYRNQFGQNSADGVRVHNYLRRHVVNGSSVQLLDVNEHYAELDFDYADMRDDGHVNFSGSEKTSRFLGDYIGRHYAGQFASG